MIRSINEPEAAVRNALLPNSINEPQALPDGPPSIEGLNPASAAPGGAAFVVIHGANFTPECYVLFDDEMVLAANFESETKMNVTLPASEAGAHDVAIGFGPFEGGYKSQSATFTVGEVKAVRTTSERSANLSEVIEDPTDPDQLEDEIEAAEEDGDFVPTHGAKPKSKKGKK